MKKQEYLGAIESALTFYGSQDRKDVLEDMLELYEGLAEQGLDDEAVQQRIGTPEEVAGEYRAANQLDKVERSPNAATGARLGWMTLTGRIARGAGVQLFGLVWLGLAVVLIGIAAVVLVGLAIAVLTGSGYEPIVAVFAVPDIPILSGVAISLSIATIAFASLLAVRIVMRLIVRAVRIRSNVGHAGAGRRRQRTTEQMSKWVNTWKAVLHLALGALALSAVGAVAYVALPSPEFPVLLDRSVRVDLTGVRELVINATRNRVTIVSGTGSESGVAVAELRKEMEYTLGQAFTLESTDTDGSEVITSVYREGLSWGVNPFPDLTITIPDDLSVPLTVVLTESTIDIDSLSDELRSLVTVQNGT